MAKLTVVSLFSGCGGMDLGLQGGFDYLGKRYSKNPYKIVFANDIDKHFCEIYNENFDYKCINKDINNIKSHEIPPHHILIAGFPCQSFSVIAQNPPRLGYKDKNGKLFLEIFRILNDRKPLIFIAENVKGILSANNKKAFPLIIKKFEEAGYHTTYKLLDSSDFGIPQKRQRVFIIGCRDNKLLESFRFPKPTTPNKKIPLSTVVYEEKYIDQKYYFSKRALNGLVKSNKSMNKGRVQNLEFPCNTVGAHLSKVSLNSTDPVLRLNGKYRRFTPREVARIQSFPDNFKLSYPDTHVYKALGNAVPPVLMWHISKALLKCIKDNKQNILISKPYRTNKEIRSYNMSKIKSKNTKIELILRKKLFSLGFRYNINAKDIYGKPDIVFRKKKVAIFCDSSFWHGKNLNSDTERIKTNKDYWINKISKNKERDNKVNKKLKEQGWKVLRFWDSDISNNTDNVVSLIKNELKAIQ